VDHTLDDGAWAGTEVREVDAGLEDAVALRLDRVDHASTSSIASRGQTSTHAKQRVQRSSTTSGRPGAASNARSGHVAKQAPQAVQSAFTVTVMAGTPAA
jgi:hypothetical protein